MNKDSNIVHGQQQPYIIPEGSPQGYPSQGYPPQGYPPGYPPPQGYPGYPPPQGYPPSEAYFPPPQAYPPQVAVQYSPVVDAAITGPVSNYSASPLSRCLDKNGKVSWEYLSAQDTSEREKILSELKTDRNLDILQKMAIRVCFPTTVGGVRTGIPVSLYITCLVIGILVIIYGAIWGIVGIILGVVYMSVSSSYGYSSYSKAADLTAIYYFVGSPITLIGAIIIGIILIVAGARRTASPKSFMTNGIIVLVLGVVVGFVCLFFVNIAGGIIMMVVLIIITILMIVKGRQAQTSTGGQGVSFRKDESFDILCVGFLNKAHGPNWVSLPEYINLQKYPFETIRFTVNTVYNKYPGDLA